MKRALAITFDGVMLSNGVSSSDELSSGSVPSVMVPRVNAADAGQRQHAAAESRSAHRARQLDAGDAHVAEVVACASGPDGVARDHQILRDEVLILVEEVVGAAAERVRRGT